MGRFKTKKKKFNNLMIYVGLFLISIAFSCKYLYKENLINKDTFIDILLTDTLELDNDITDVDFLFKYALNMDLKNDIPVFEEVKEQKVEDINIIEDDLSKPIVYIYNSHQTEKYTSGYLESYNISSTVLLASKILKEYLEDLGIGVIVEENSVEEKLYSLNWKYGSSYKVSRMFMEEAKANNPSLIYFIDLHRDSSVYEKTTMEINGEKYARLLFVIGLDNENYEPNLKLAENLRERIDLYNKDLCRGIIKKSGKGVNGVYNQDFNSNTMLIEVGGQYNNISEVNNTLKVFANILSEYIKGDLDG